MTLDQKKLFIGDNLGRSMQDLLKRGNGIVKSLFWACLFSPSQFFKFALMVAAKDAFLMKYSPKSFPEIVNMTENHQGKWKQSCQYQITFLPKMLYILQAYTNNI